MFEVEIERKLARIRKEKARRDNQRKRKKPSYKGYDFRNWLVYPIGVIYVEMQLVHDRKYQALEWSCEKADAIINKYLVDICDYDEDTGELSFSTEWHTPWKHHANKKDRLWCTKFGYEITRYLETTYECEGFTKSVDGYYDEWIIFKKQEVTEQ